MKIAFFHELTPLSGARKVVEEYGKILSKEHLIDLYYVDQTEDKDVNKIFNKVYFFQFDQNKIKLSGWKLRLYKDSIQLIKLYFLHKKIAKIIKNNKYDFIFVSPSKYSQAPFMLRFLNNTVYFCHEPLRIAYDAFLQVPKNLNLVKSLYERLNRYFRKIIDKENIKKANIVLSNSLFSKENIKRAYGLNSFLCYLGVDVNEFKNLNFKKKQDILFIGEKTEIEGYDILEEVLKLYKTKPTVEFVTRDKNGVGINEHELIKKINESKIILSLSRFEPFGLIPIEAMACETPVIALSEGGLKESVKNNVTGYLVKNNNEIKGKIDLLLKDEILAKKLGRAGRQEVLSKFTWNISVGNFLKIIDENIKAK